MRILQWFQVNKTNLQVSSLVEARLADTQTVTNPLHSHWGTQTYLIPQVNDIWYNNNVHLIPCPQNDVQKIFSTYRTMIPILLDEGVDI